MEQQSPTSPLSKQRADANAPENIENYLENISQCKFEIQKLTTEIFELRAEKINLELGNSKIAQSLIDKANQNIKETELALKDAKQKQAEALKNEADLNEKLSAYNIAVSDYQSAKAKFEESQRNAIAALKSQQLDSEQQGFNNDNVSILLKKRKEELDAFELELKERQQKLNELDIQLEAKRVQNQSEGNRIDNELETLQAQTIKIHQEIAEYSNQREADLKTNKDMLDRTELERKKNEIILQQITESSERVQELIINQKISQREAEAKIAILRAQEDRVREMTITLQGLKEELSKDNKQQEATK